MSKHQLLNRRLVYLETDNLGVVSNILEEVDVYLAQSQMLEKTSSSVYIYTTADSTSDSKKSRFAYKVGREVVGHDSQIKYHDRLKMIDFSESIISFSTKIEVQNYSELHSCIQQHIQGHTSCRIQTTTFREFSLEFF